MKTIKLTTDITDILSNKGSPSLITPYIKDSIWFTLKQDSYTSGLIRLECLNSVLWVPHIFIYEEYRGNGSEEWGKQVVKYMEDKLEARKFLVLTPYEAAKRYAEKVGFKQVGVLTNSIKKDGKLLNQYMMEK